MVGAFDHLVMMAALLAYVPIEQFDSAVAQRIIAGKIQGPFHAVKHAALRRDAQMEGLICMAEFRLHQEEVAEIEHGFTERTHHGRNKKNDPNQP